MRFQNAELYSSDDIGRNIIDQIKSDFDFSGSHGGNSGGSTSGATSGSSRSSYPSPSYSPHPPGLVVAQTQAPSAPPGQPPPPPPMPQTLSLTYNAQNDPFNGQLTELSSVNFVQQWLRRKSFHNFQSKFANFSGQDMLFMKREDFIQIGLEVQRVLTFRLNFVFGNYLSTLKFLDFC